MDFEKFVNEIQENIKQYLPEDYQDAEVTFMEHQKLNEQYTGLTVRKDGQLLTPTMNLNRLHDYYQNHSEVPMSTVIEKIADVITEAPDQINLVDLKDIMKYDNVKDKLFIRLSSAERNEEMLQNVPHELKEDLAITYHVVVAKDSEGLSSMLITNEMMKEYGVTQEQLQEDAMKSAPSVMTPQIYSMGGKLNELMKDLAMVLTQEEKEMMRQVAADMAQNNSFLIVTNDQTIDGAGVIFYPEVMENLGYMLDGDFFILPSSVHETLVLMDDGTFDIEALKEMVQEVNETQVMPQERLTDEVYHYDAKDHVFEKADRFAERQKEKAMQAVKAEKAGKEQPDQKPKAKKHDMEL